jgi:hypothetical protein
MPIFKLVLFRKRWNVVHVKTLFEVEAKKQPFYKKWNFSGNRQTLKKLDLCFNILWYPNKLQIRKVMLVWSWVLKEGGIVHGSKKVIDLGKIQICQETLEM